MKNIQFYSVKKLQFCQIIALPESILHFWIYTDFSSEISSESVHHTQFCLHVKKVKLQIFVNLERKVI